MTNCRRRTALLRHDLPDGSHHFDWLFAIDEPAAAPLKTFRVSARPDLALVGDVLDALPIGDHRTRYLDYEGPISGGRGSVRRLAAGRYEWLRGGESAGSWGEPAAPGAFEVRWEGEGEAEAAGAIHQVWEFTPPARFRLVEP